MSLTAQADAQLNEQRTIRREHKQTYQLMGGITLVVIGIWIGAQLFGNDAGFTINLYTELLSIGVTVLVLNWFAERRAIRLRKQELFLQLGSQSNDFALEAKRQLEMEGWLEEALAHKKFLLAGWQGILLWKTDLTNAQLPLANLTGAILEHSNLTNANLSGAKLVGAKLWEVTLRNAELHDADLSGAELWGADLRKSTLAQANFTSAELWNADLTEANLKSAILTNANLATANLTKANLTFAYLKGTDLTSANLSDTDLTGVNLTYSELFEANLTNANFADTDLTGADMENTVLKDARFNQRTKLPDGSRWVDCTDVLRFTDRDHPQFWRSDDPQSPAYGGG